MLFPGLLEIIAHSAFGFFVLNEFSGCQEKGMCEFLHMFTTKKRTKLCYQPNLAVSGLSSALM